MPDTDSKSSSSSPAAKQGWYRDGLRFECTRCGNCCTGAPGYVWVTAEEITALASFLGLSIGELGRKYLRKVGSRHSLIEKANGDCVFFEKGCTVYPSRPVQCRTFPFWSENLRSRKTWEEASGECPGMGDGKLYSVAEIRRIRSGDADASSS